MNEAMGTVILAKCKRVVDEQTATLICITQLRGFTIDRTGATPHYGDGRPIRSCRVRYDASGQFSKPPLTPPPTEQKSGTMNEHILRDIKRCKSGRGFSTNPWLRYQLSSIDYKVLLDVETSD